MTKSLITVMVIILISCTDQGNPIMYSIKNTSEHDLYLVLFSRSGTFDTLTMNNGETKLVSTDVPSYDCGPLCGYDSVRVVFDDIKILIYTRLRSNEECIDSIKNPFCPYLHYTCISQNCVFAIDSLEYLKAK